MFPDSPLDPHRSSSGRELIVVAALVAMHIAFAAWALALLP